VIEQFHAALPFDFVAARISLSWRDASWAISEHIVAPSFAVELANAWAQDRPGEEAVLELAARDVDEPVLDLVTQLAQREPDVDITQQRAKWAFVLLEWLFLHRERFLDPLAIVERIYADFEYPEDVETFVRYMPMQGEDPGSRERNEQRLYERWSQYLERARARFAPGRDGVDSRS
jgi:hypothetical protein